MMSVPYRSHFSVHTSQFVFTFGARFQVRGSVFVSMARPKASAEPNLNTNREARTGKREHVSRYRV
jgi:hypothetical protein